MQDVADHAGVSMMTVSRALRNSPKVRSATRQKIQAVARDLGYEVNPLLGRYLSMVKLQRKRGVPVLACIQCISKKGQQDIPWQYTPVAHLAKAAADHGFRLDVFELENETKAVHRLHQILTTRGIEGLLISPHPLHEAIRKFDFSNFVAVTIGYGLRKPDLHRVGTDVMTGTRRLLQCLEKRGHKRVGMAISRWLDQRTNYGYSGAFNLYQESFTEESRLDTFYFHEENLNNERERFCQWVKTERPDVIIAFEEYVAGWLREDLGLTVGEEIELVLHDWVAGTSGELPGLDHRRDLVCASAVQLLVMMLVSNDFGIPESPLRMLVTPKVRGFD